MSRPHFTPGRDPIPILQEARWAPGPVWTGGKSRPHRDSVPDRLALSSVPISAEPPGPQLYCNRKVKVKVNLTQEQATRAQWGSRCIALLFLQPRRKMGLVGQRHAATALPPGKIRYKLYYFLLVIFIFLSIESLVARSCVCNK